MILAGRQGLTHRKKKGSLEEMKLKNGVVLVISKTNTSRSFPRSSRLAFYVSGKPAELSGSLVCSFEVALAS